MTHDQFFVGQRVRIFDEDEGCNVYGHVKAIETERISIQWPDFDAPVWHSRQDWEDIKDGSPKTSL